MEFVRQLMFAADDNHISASQHDALLKTAKPSCGLKLLYNKRNFSVISSRCAAHPGACRS
jgi:hypothetical protein